MRQSGILFIYSGNDVARKIWQSAVQEKEIYKTIPVPCPIYIKNILVTCIGYSNKGLYRDERTDPQFGIYWYSHPFGFSFLWDILKINSWVYVKLYCIFQHYLIYGEESRFGYISLIFSVLWFFCCHCCSLTASFKKPGVHKRWLHYHIHQKQTMEIPIGPLLHIYLSVLLGPSQNALGRVILKVSAQSCSPLLYFGHFWETSILLPSVLEMSLYSTLVVLNLRSMNLLLKYFADYIST